MRVLCLLGALLFSGACAATHTVRAGQTLYSISRLSGVSVEDLIRLNNLQSSTLQAGQVINLGQGQISADQADQTSFTPANQAAVPQPQDAAAASVTIRAASTRYLNVPYVWGGTSPSGMDCSGFTSSVMAQLGVRIPRTAAQQFAGGAQVNRADLREGDLLFFNTSGGVSHVGLYLGEGEMINANSVSGRVIIEPVFSSPYWKPRYLGARRYLS